jgi:hypothetical protein
LRVSPKGFRDENVISGMRLDANEQSDYMFISLYYFIQYSVVEVDCVDYVFVIIYAETIMFYEWLE